MIQKKNKNNTTNQTTRVPISLLVQKKLSSAQLHFPTTGPTTPTWPKISHHTSPKPNPAPDASPYRLPHSPNSTPPPASSHVLPTAVCCLVPRPSAVCPAAARRLLPRHRPATRAHRPQARAPRAQAGAAVAAAGRPAPRRASRASSRCARGAAEQRRPSRRGAAALRSRWLVQHHARGHRASLLRRRWRLPAGG